MLDSFSKLLSKTNRNFRWFLSTLNCRPQKWYAYFCLCSTPFQWWKMGVPKDFEFRNLKYCRLLRMLTELHHISQYGKIFNKLWSVPKMPSSDPSVSTSGVASYLIVLLADEHVNCELCSHHNCCCCLFLNNNFVVLFFVSDSEVRLYSTACTSSCVFSTYISKNKTITCWRVRVNRKSKRIKK